jgi:hypothetical protein
VIGILLQVFCVQITKRKERSAKEKHNAENGKETKVEKNINNCEICDSHSGAAEDSLPRYNAVQIGRQVSFRGRFLRTALKGKAVPLQAWRGLEFSRRLRFPYFKTIGTWR